MNYGEYITWLLKIETLRNFCNSFSKLTYSVLISRVQKKYMNAMAKDIKCQASCLRKIS
jgi:hypothetical protein